MKMKLNAAWTYRTAITTIDFGEGEHDVEPHIHAAAVAAGAIAEGESNGRGGSVRGGKGSDADTIEGADAAN